MPQISILLAYRNREIQRIKRCLDSLANQSFNDFEVIFVDYGSDDTSETQSFLTKYSFVRYYYLSTQGWEWNKSKALNFGIKHAKSDYLISTDIDLIYSPQLLEHILSLKDHYGHLHCQVYWLPKNFRNYPNLFNENLSGFTTSGHDGLGGVHGFSKKHVHEIGGYDEHYAFWGMEDRDMNHRLNELGLSHHWIDHKEYPVFHQWHPSATFKSFYLMPDKWYDNAALYFSRKKHTVKRNTKSWGTDIQINQRPILKVLNSEPKLKYSFNSNGNTIQRVRTYETIVSDFENLKSGDSCKIEFDRGTFRFNLNAVQKILRGFITLLLSLGKINYTLNPPIYTQLAERQKHFIPFIDMNYLVWFLIRESGLVEDYYFKEHERYREVWLLRSSLTNIEPGD